MAGKRKKSVLSKVLNFFLHSPHRGYLIGGLVRDLILGREPVDIDLVVEDDIKTLTTLLSRKLKGKCLIYPEFGTATIRVGNEQIDLARARTETYPEPARLPMVRFADISADFARRDFTVNAIALALTKKSFGQIIDPVAGIRDIRGKTIRVLHARSFIDDPTRIFRALRYRHRLGFKIDRETDRLMKTAIREKMIDRLSGQRVLNEYRLIAAERNWRKIILNLGHYGIGRFSRTDLDLMERLGTMKIYYLLGKTGGVKFPLNRKEMKLTAEIVKLRQTVRKITLTKTNHALFQLLSPLEPETVKNLSAAQPKLKAKIRKYRRLKLTRPIVSGRDLARLGLKPGPRYRETLRRLFYLQLDGKLRKKGSVLKNLKK